jgi:hypothetical protein
MGAGETDWRKGAGVAEAQEGAGVADNRDERAPDVDFGVGFRLKREDLEHFDEAELLSPLPPLPG